jgi:uncharacterized protein YecE (DUF72 family)
MNEPILIGARGWDYPGWHGRFYPEELPEDWRLTYYNNLLRAVLVPAEVWPGVTADTVRVWADDSDVNFRFIVETPATLDDPAAVAAARVAEFHALLAPLGARLAGLLWRISAAAPCAVSSLRSALRLFGNRYPLCVDLPDTARGAEALACLAQHEAGQCWRTEATPAPSPTGRLIVALADEAQPRAQRALLERLAAAATRERQAALFFATAEQAGQARLIAEMMGV